MQRQYGKRREQVCFSLYECPAEADLIKLREVLSSFGFEVHLKVGKKSLEPGGIEVEIKWDEETVHRHKTRNAGRLYQACSVPWERINQWRAQRISSTEIANRLQVSRATYYNHLKLRKSEPDYPYF